MRYTNYENDILSAPIATVGADTRHWDRSSVLFSFLFFFPSCLSSFFLFFPFFFTCLSPVRTDSSGPTISVDCLKVHVPTISHLGADSCRTFFAITDMPKLWKLHFVFTDRNASAPSVYQPHSRSWSMFIYFLFIVLLFPIFFSPSWFSFFPFHFYQLFFVCLLSVPTVWDRQFSVDCLKVQTISHVAEDSCRSFFSINDKPKLWKWHFVGITTVGTDSRH